LKNESKVGVEKRKKPLLKIIDLLPKLSICKNETHSNNFEKDKIKKASTPLSLTILKL
jgi:hypothetical protein